ncbi:MAG TPA: hypothetical protein VGH36_04370 [Acetobacteraceae bacterium]
MTARIPPSGYRMPGQDSGDWGSMGRDMQELARDWVTLWQSELAGGAADREMQETWQRLLALWAGAASAVLAGSVHGGADVRRPGPPAAARPSPAAAASDARDAEIDRLAKRVAELERRLAARDDMR